MSLTANGLERPRLNELKASLDALFTEALGPVTTTPDSVVGQLTGIEAEALANLWEAVQDNYDSMYPFSAEGTALDGAVSFVGIERLPATPTTVIAMVYGRRIDASAHWRAGALNSQPAVCHDYRHSDYEGGSG